MWVKNSEAKKKRCMRQKDVSRHYFCECVYVPRRLEIISKPAASPLLVLKSFVPKTHKSIFTYFITCPGLMEEEVPFLIDEE